MQSPVLLALKKKGGSILLKVKRACLLDVTVIPVSWLRVLPLHLGRNLREGSSKNRSSAALQQPAFPLCDSSEPLQWAGGKCQMAPSNVIVSVPPPHPNQDPYP